MRSGLKERLCSLSERVAWSGTLTILCLFGFCTRGVSSGFDLNHTLVVFCSSS